LHGYLLLANAPQARAAGPIFIVLPLFAIFEILSNSFRPRLLQRLGKASVATSIRYFSAVFSAVFTNYDRMERNATAAVCQPRRRAKFRSVEGFMPRKQTALAEGRFLFQDRTEAGQLLAAELAALKPVRPLVLALPRGGVPVAIEIARALHAPLDLLLVRKIGLPWQPELAVGAVLDGDRPHTVINRQVARAAHMDDADIARIAKTQLEEIEHRRRKWLSHRAPIPIRGRSAILVDDGVATGASMRVALEAVRKEGALRVILASPVVPDFAAEVLRQECDAAVFLATPKDLVAVGMYYRDFHQLRDDEVKQLLDQAWEHLPAS
jgi:putative phosphoribosyl transferase